MFVGEIPDIVGIGGTRKNTCFKSKALSFQVLGVLCLIDNLAVNISTISLFYYTPSLTWSVTFPRLKSKIERILVFPSRILVGRC